MLSALRSKLTARNAATCLIKYKQFSSQTPFRKATHCIFDLDGLLLNTEFLYKDAFTEVVKEYGKEYTVELQMKHMGTPSKVGCQIIIDYLKINTSCDELESRFRKIAWSLIDKAELMPGAEELIHHLVKNKIPIAIATASEANAFDVKTRRYQEFFKLFHHIVISTRDREVMRGKPHPDVYLVAASRFDEKPHPSNCLGFEDSAHGVKAAISAGMQCVMIPDPIMPKDYHKFATVVAPALNKVPLEKFGIPPINT